MTVPRLMIEPGANPRRTTPHAERPPCVAYGCVPVSLPPDPDALVRLRASAQAVVEAYHGLLGSLPPQQYYCTRTIEALAAVLREGETS